MKLGVPFNDLSRLPESLKSEIRETVANLSVSGRYILGDFVADFEAKLSNFLKVRDVVSVASGTDALIVALSALGIQQGEIVLTTANAGAYTSIAAKSIGAEPVFIDVSQATLQMTVHDFERSLEICQRNDLQPKALVVTHLYGQLNSQIEKIVSLARAKGIAVIEDCAQVLGARNPAGMAGSFGDVSTFSFYPTKNLGAAGDGGALATNRPELKKKIRMLRQYGWGEKYHIEIADGRNSRLDEIQAAILGLKLPYLNEWNQRRREIFARYVNAANNSVKYFSDPLDEGFVAHLAVIQPLSVSRSEAEHFFRQADIQTSRHFPVPDHRQSLKVKYRDLVTLPVTEWSSENCMSIPLFPELYEEEIVKIENVLANLGGTA